MRQTGRGFDMDKKIGRPHEGIAVTNGEGPDDIAHGNDGTTDTEGHGLTSSLPGTGGDSLNPRRPSSGGEFIDENDVEGHGLTNSMPGTGGDSLNPRRPSSGGEAIGDEDVEGPELRLR
jgi:hypothetical protein